MPLKTQLSVRSVSWCVSIDFSPLSTKSKQPTQAYEYALREQPARAVSKMVDVFDALELKESCQVILFAGIFYPRNVTSHIIPQLARSKDRHHRNSHLPPSRFRCTRLEDCWPRFPTQLTFLFFLLQSTFFVDPIKGSDTAAVQS